MSEHTFFCTSLPDAFIQAGMVFPDKEVVRDKMLRFSTNGKPANKAGWMRVFPDGVGAVFGCYKKGTSFVWQQRDSNAPPLSREEYAAIYKKAAQARQQADDKQARQYANAARSAVAIWQDGTPLDALHAYVQRKGITPYAARRDNDGSVLLPVHDSDGDLQSLQFIGDDGSKRFLHQGKMKTGRLLIGEVINGLPLILAEGWATACSIHAATDCPVVVAFSGGNLKAVASDLRRQLPDSSLLVAADLDTHGKGLEYAQEAAAAGDGTVLLPVFADGRDQGDFNDLHQDEGLEVVRRLVRTEIAFSTCAPNHEEIPFIAPKLPKSDARDGTATTRPLTEHGNALRLLDAHGDRLRYAYDLRRWLIWGDGAWKWDDGAGVCAMAAELHADIYDEGSKFRDDGENFAKWARKSQELRTIEAAVKLLSHQKKVRLSSTRLDADPLTIGLNQGRQIIDLKKGQIRVATAGDYITKSLNVETVGHASKAMRWREFLSQVFEGDDELIGWLQRFCGYMLTGSTQEQIFLFCYGHGANGKSVFAEMLKHIMGDYGCALASETLSESRRQAGGATPDLAALIGTRMALCSETEDNTALAESLVKSLVAGDSMSVRQLYSGPVPFTPNFKLLMLGNHKPIVRGNDDGIWRRMRLINFNRTFTSEERDPHLLTALKAEAQHILSWMLDGCSDWHHRGLSEIPTAIRQATEAYQVDQDITGTWMGECTLSQPHAETAAGDLYGSYKNWMLDNGHKPASNAVFGRRLAERSYVVRQSNGKRWWKGIVLRGSRSNF